MTSAGENAALLGIDVGTSGVKLLLWFLPSGRDGKAAPPRVARAGVRVRRTSEGTSEINPRRWWQAVGRAAGKLDLAGARVVGIGTSALFPALVATDGGGRPLRPAILYDDRRSAPEVRDFEHTPLGHPALAHLLTGNRVRPGTISLSSLLWLREHEPEVFERAARFGHAGSYLGERLTGRFAWDTTNASLTGLWATASGEAWLRGVCRNAGVRPEQVPRRLSRMTYGQCLELLASRRRELKSEMPDDVPLEGRAKSPLTERVTLPQRGWIEALCDAVGVGAGRLGEVLWPTERLGELTPEAARTLGLEPGLPVAVGAGDTACAALGMGLAKAGEVGAACGSTDSLVAVQRTAAFSPRTIDMAYLDGSTWLSASPMNATGASVEWFAESLFGRGRRRYERFFELAGEAAPGSDGVVFLPYLAGERSPVYDPAARGVFFGLTLETGREAMARAVLEGIGFGHRQILQMTDVRLGRPARRVVAAGRAVAHPVARRTRADAADRRYEFTDLTDVSALGAALLGGVAAGVFDSWREAAAAARKAVSRTPVEPNGEAWHQMKRNFEVYSSLYDALKHCFAR